MTFRQLHAPQSFDELIFHDPDVDRVVRDYADGKRTKHLILHGPKGSGKSSAARMILKSRLSVNFDDMTTEPLNGRTDQKRKTWDIIQNNWNIHIFNSGRGYTHIDEIDRYSTSMLDQLDEYLEHDRLGTLVMTTNHLENLDEWFTDRCATVEVLRPLGSDMVIRAHAILQAEGYSFSQEQVMSMIGDFHGSLRKMLEAIETYVLTHPADHVPSDLATRTGTPAANLVDPMKNQAHSRTLTKEGRPA
jgi:replication factor C subunit 3/5